MQRDAEVAQDQRLTFRFHAFSNDRNTHNRLVSNGADGDGDGRISLQEYNDYNLSLSVEATIAALDENADGEISSQEFVTDVDNQLTESDTNQDGVISAADDVSS